MTLTPQWPPRAPCRLPRPFDKFFPNAPARAGLAVAGKPGGQALAHRAVAQRHDLVGQAVLISDCAADTLRRAPGAIYVTVVFGDGAISRARKTNSAPGTLTAVGIDTRHCCATADVENGRSAPSRMKRFFEFVQRCRRVGRMLDEFAESLARHIDARDTLKPAAAMCRHAAVHKRHTRYSRCAKAWCRGRTRRETVIVVSQSTNAGAARQ